jgi:hypothetical protein
MQRTKDCRTRLRMTCTADLEKAQFNAALGANKMQVVRAWFAPMLKGSPAQVQEEDRESAVVS